ncbi:TetR/AcrR family transcriptional regulator [Streptomyces acidiscabies]|uniref:Helix-turn-helix domain containing protein n=1 Tax=Streptomyces acidiscabies TaxID=42234 RepID=A0AAP6EFN1_9ACTN|nr:TetR/AcrR family transcriptional regulator [Streptomyces acidiscabies]MBZ3916049.1 TetR/AcrR family transcriptional regulator [Streptomyces acidiscabies]MDX2960440.1 helix-turn-helix domain containing protein [Streptomyces acidiscabies]MDX3017726.1 helix-turn-helix domain containing protein [Streptomyces acidiscabies]MDX3794345.1 helix-turn-helix domain containing protein [Streptomyces acidiscabies]GAQ50840.1 HTH-type transcriptional repressor KstR2 [Streptomyces acidiscabies]
MKQNEEVSQPPLRADARRNRATILTAAHEVFAEEGLDVQIQVVAQRAGVAVGTVFRHFPTKEALIEAVGAMQLRTVLDRFGRALEEPDPPGAFERLVWHLTGQYQLYRAVPPALANDSSPEIEQLRVQLYELLGRTVALAQEGGRIRADLELTDIMLLVTACAHVAEGTSRTDPALRKRFMTVVFDGMRPAGGSPLPKPTHASPLGSWLAVYQAQR